MTPKELNVRLDAYLSLREALGFQTRREGNLLRDFVRFIETKGFPQPLRAQLSVEWACSGKLCRGGSGHVKRLNVARGFLSHLRAMMPETEVPERGLVASYRRPKPYIFSQQEVDVLMSAALRTHPRGTLHPHTLYTLIGLLASTGLRTGEALRLTVSDIQLDLKPPQLQILNSKFHKSRIVPLHPTTAEMLRSYVHRRKQFGFDGTGGPFFLSNRGAPFPGLALMRWFMKLTRKLGLRPQSDKPRPLLNSFRHTFAVRRMLTWYQEKADVLSLLPNLAVYMGHLRPQENYWYLSATPELLGAAAERFLDYSGLGGES